MPSVDRRPTPRSAPSDWLTGRQSISFISNQHGHPSEHSQIRGGSESPHCVLKLWTAQRMVSIGFDAVAGLDGLSFTIKSVLAGRVHQITRAATRRTDLHMLHDALGGIRYVHCFG